MGNARKRNITVSKNENEKANILDEGKEIKKTKDKFPHLANGQETTKKPTGLLISVYLEIYQNIKWLQKPLRTVSVQDLKLLLKFLFRLFINTNRKTHVAVGFGKYVWFSFAVICSLALCTRLYDVEKPGHVW